MKFSAVFTTLACALAVSAVPIEPGMDQASNAMVESSHAIITDVAQTVAAKVISLLRNSETTESEYPHMVGEPTFFVVDKA